MRALGRCGLLGEQVLIGSIGVACFYLMERAAGPAQINQDTKLMLMASRGPSREGCGGVSPQPMKSDWPLVSGTKVTKINRFTAAVIPRESRRRVAFFTGRLETTHNSQAVHVYPKTAAIGIGKMKRTIARTQPGAARREIAAITGNVIITTADVIMTVRALSNSAEATAQD